MSMSEQFERWHKISEGHLERNPRLRKVKISEIMTGDRYISPSDPTSGWDEFDVLVLQRREKEGDQIPFYVKFMKPHSEFGENEAPGGKTVIHEFDSEVVYKYV